MTLAYRLKSCRSYYVVRPCTCSNCNIAGSTPGRQGVIGSLPPALTAGSTAKLTVNYRKTGGDWEPVTLAVLPAGSTAKVTVNYRKTGGDWEPVTCSNSW